MNGLPMTYKKTLVTGGAGFIGSHLVRALLANGVTVSVIDDLSTGRRENIPEGVSFTPGDILDDRVLVKAMAGCEVVFHLAARVSIRDSVDKFFEDGRINLCGTLNVLRHAVAANIRKFLFASSMAVYSDCPTSDPVDENYETKPISPYGLSKLAAEQYCEMVGKHSGMKTVSLRFFNTYGPGQAYTPYVGVITIFINRLLAGKAPTVFGDGLQTRDFVSVADIVQGCLLAMNSDQSGLVFNIGTGNGTSVATIAGMLCEKLAPDRVPVFDHARPGEIRNSIADCQRARQIIGYGPTGKLSDDLDAVINDIRSRFDGGG